MTECNAGPIVDRFRIWNAHTRRALVVGCGILFIGGGCGGKVANEDVLATATAQAGSSSESTNPLTGGSWDGNTVTGVGTGTSLALGGIGGGALSAAGGASVTMGGLTSLTGGVSSLTTGVRFSGGVTSASGGVTNATGGMISTTGGITSGTGGMTSATGGMISATGGVDSGTGQTTASDQCVRQCTDGRVCRRIVKGYDCVTASCGPELVTTVKLPDEDAGLVVLGDGYAYVLTRTALEVLDVQSPRTPKIVGELAGTFLGIAFDGNRVYLTDTVNGLIVVDVNIPAQPKVLTTLEVSGGAHCVHADGAVAYVCAGDRDTDSGYLQVVDLSQPDQPSLRGQLPTPPSVTSIDSAGPIAYLVDDAGRFVVVDASDLDYPTVLTSLDLDARSATVDGSRAFVGTSTELLVFDITDPSEPARVADVTTQGYPVRSLDVDHDLVVWASSDGPSSSFWAHDVSDLAKPIASRMLGDSANWRWEGPLVAIDNGFAYVPRTGELAVYDLSTLVNERIVSSYVLPTGAVVGIELEGSRVYVIDSSFGPESLQIINNEDPLHPRSLGSFPVMGTGLAIRNQRAYLLAAGVPESNNIPDFGFLELDVRNPAELSASSPFGWLALEPSLAEKLTGQIAITPAGDHAYLLGEGVLFVVRVGQSANPGDPVDPVLVSTLDLPGLALNRIRLTATHAFITASLNGADAALESGALLVLDLSEPGNPSLVATLATSAPLAGLELAGSHAYVGAIGQGLIVIDVSVPSAPRVAAVVNTPEDGQENLVVMNDRVYVGEAAIDVSVPEQPTFRDRIHIPGEIWRVSSAGKLFTTSSARAGNRYGYQPPRLNYVDPGRCVP